MIDQHWFWVVSWFVGAAGGFITGTWLGLRQVRSTLDAAYRMHAHAIEIFNLQVGRAVLGRAPQRAAAAKTEEDAT